MYPLEASDEHCTNGLAGRNDLVSWLESWLKDEDSRTCKLEKLKHFNADCYSLSN